MWDVCWGIRMEAAFEDFVLQAPCVEKYLQYRIYTDVTEGGLGLHNATWACLCALIQLVQRALRVPNRPMMKRTNSGPLPHMVEKYRKILLSFGMEMGRLPSRRPIRHQTGSSHSLMMRTLMSIGFSRLCPTSTSNPCVPRPALAPCNPTLCNQDVRGTSQGNRPTMTCTTQHISLSPPSHSKYVGRAGIGTPKRRIACKIIKAGLATNWLTSQPKQAVLCTLAVVWAAHHPRISS